jgi:MinD-like ATPase involved in chromosome partitioning or flagellar assembly
VPRDPAVWQAVRRQTPFILGYPGAPASRAVTAMVQTLLYGKGGRSAQQQKPTGFFDRLAGLFGRKAV